MRFVVVGMRHGRKVRLLRGWDKGAPLCERCGGMWRNVEELREIATNRNESGEDVEIARPTEPKGQITARRLRSWPKARIATPTTV
jgi:hypothetical protein